MLHAAWICKFIDDEGKHCRHMIPEHKGPEEGRIIIKKAKEHLKHHGVERVTEYFEVMTFIRKPQALLPYKKMGASA